MDLSGYEAFANPIPASAFGWIALVCMVIGLGSAGVLAATLAISNKYNRNVSEEVIIAAIASVFLGFGTCFLLLANDIWF